MLLRPVSVRQIAEWANAGQRMPPKTTYFHPKPATGMVFRTLDPIQLAGVGLTPYGPVPGSSLGARSDPRTG